MKKIFCLLVLISLNSFGVPPSPEINRQFVKANIPRWIRQVHALEKATNKRDAFQAIPEFDKSYIGSLVFGEGSPCIAKLLQARYDLILPLSPKSIVVYDEKGEFFIIKNARTLI